MSEYVKIMELRKIALRKGKTEEAMKLQMKAMRLRKAGKVSPEEMQAAAYL